MIDDQNQLQFSRLQGKKNSVLEEISELCVKSQMDATTKPSIDDVSPKPEN
jgi:hypothetical protein